MAIATHRLSGVIGVTPGNEKPRLDYLDFGELVEYTKQDGSTFMAAHIPACHLHPTLATLMRSAQAKLDPDRAGSGMVKIGFSLIKRNESREQRSASSIPDAAIADNDDDIHF